LFNPIEKLSDAPIELPEKPVSAIDVQPNIAVACERHHLRDRINSSGVGRAGVRDNCDRNQFRGCIPIERRF
jgi:hypothetical protein